jgi:CobQ/CobB/MinD/ParA nucleotide binding domain
MEHIIAFHSYNGGAGKTTIAANYAAILASKGYRVCLLDLDVYAPSLHTYFEKRPSRWINDFLTSNTILVDFTHVVSNSDSSSSNANANGKHLLIDNKGSSSEFTGSTKLHEGKLWVGFCNLPEFCHLSNLPSYSAVKREREGRNTKSSSNVTYCHSLFLLMLSVYNLSLLYTNFFFFHV